MDGEELAYAGIARQAELIRDGAVSSRELTELYLRRIERLGGRLNPFTEILAERALAEVAPPRRGEEGGAGALQAGEEPAPDPEQPEQREDPQGVVGGVEAADEPGEERCERLLVALEDPPGAGDGEVPVGRRRRPGGPLVVGPVIRTTARSSRWISWWWKVHTPTPSSTFVVPPRAPGS